MAHLTTQQLQTLKTYIANTPALNALPNNPDGNFEIARQLNLPASPVFIVWKTNVPISTIGINFNAAELATRSTADNTRLQTIAQYLPGGINPSLLDHRNFFDDIFSGVGGSNTRAKLLALWKRSATAFEKLYATGTGSDGSPATLVIEGEINYNHVEEARNS